MNRALLLMSFIFLLNSCKGLKEKHYKTAEVTTDSFIDIQFDLYEDNTLNLIIVSQKAIIQNDSGTVFKPDTLIVTGHWEVSKGNIHCEINVSEEFIGEAFFKSSIKTKEIIQNYNYIIFPVTTDTVYIFGQPCIGKETTNR